MFSDRITLNCVECGSAYLQKPSLRSSSKFCSIRCKQRNRTTVGLIATNCKSCGKLFKRRLSRLGEFCCYACMGTAKQKRITRACAICGNPFEILQCHAKNRKCCSMLCGRIHFARHVLPNMGKARTKPEIAVENALKHCGIQCNPQHPIGPFLVDFYLPEHNIVLEVDGVYWHSLPSSIARDKSKNAYLRKCGHKVVRVTDIQVMASKSLPKLISAKLRKYT